MDAERDERKRIVRIIKDWIDHYPKSVFPDPPAGKHGGTVDACSARAIRLALKCILAEIKNGTGKD